MPGSTLAWVTGRPGSRAAPRTSRTRRRPVTEGISRNSEWPPSTMESVAARSPSWDRSSRSRRRLFNCACTSVSSGSMLRGVRDEGGSRPWSRSQVSASSNSVSAWFTPSGAVDCPIDSSESSSRGSRRTSSLALSGACPSASARLSTRRSRPCVQVPGA